MKEQSYTSTPPMGLTACTEPQCLCKGDLYLLPLYLYPCIKCYGLGQGKPANISYVTLQCDTLNCLYVRKISVSELDLTVLYTWLLYT